MRQSGQLPHEVVFLIVREVVGTSGQLPHEVVFLIVREAVGTTSPRGGSC